MVGEEAEGGPLVDKVAVGVDDVGFGKFLFDERDDGRHLVFAGVRMEGDVGADGGGVGRRHGVGYCWSSQRTMRREGK